VKRALRNVVEVLKQKGYEIVDWPATDHAEADEILAKFFVADGGKSLRNILEPVGEPFRPEMENYEKAKELGVWEMWQLQIRRSALCKRYLDRWVACEGLDAILGPCTPYTAPQNGTFKAIGYTGVFNVLDYSCTSFPTGIYTDKEIDVVPSDFKPYTDLDAQTQKGYDPVLTHGMPVSLQLTAKRLQEEKVLAMTERIVRDLEA